MHPILFHVTDTFFIGTYGLMIALGCIAALGLATWLGKARGFPSELFFDLTFVAILSGFLGGRVLYILLDLRGFFASPAEFIFSRTGFVFFGGLLAATGALIFMVRRRGLSVWEIADIVGPALALGHAFGRVGCHLSGCCYGGRCESGIGIEVPRVLLPDGMPWPNAWYDHWETGLVGDQALHSLPIWPVQLFEAGALVLLSAVLVLVHRRAHWVGVVFGGYLAGYAVIRFLLELLRGDEARGMFFGGLISTSQLLSITLFVAGAWILATARKREWITPKPPPAAKGQTPRKQ